jgi:hypothetical protein
VPPDHLDEHDVGAFTYRNRSNPGLMPEEPGAVLGHYVDGLDGAETRVDRQLNFALIPEAGQDATAAGRVGPSL